MTSTTPPTTSHSASDASIDAAAPDAQPAAAADAAQKNAAPPSPDGLSTSQEIAELADQLSACADQIHVRVLREIRAYGGSAVPEAVQETTRALFEDEVLLRQRANSLYTDAATLIVSALGKPQAQLVKLTADAAEKIRRIGVIGEVTGLVAGLLSLAGAAATGQALPVVAALENVYKQVKKIEALAPKKAS